MECYLQDQFTNMQIKTQVKEVGGFGGDFSLIKFSACRGEQITVANFQFGRCLSEAQDQLQKRHHIEKEIGKEVDVTQRGKNGLRYTNKWLIFKVKFTDN